MKSVLSILLFLSCCPHLWAYDPLDKRERSDYREPEKQWQEADLEIPSSFQQDDLQSFKVPDPQDRFHYYIERESLKTGSDGVTRFLLVIRSAGGAVNSSYEGMRCGHRQYKVYAYGGDKRLTAMIGSQWQAIPKIRNDYRTVLYEDLLCNLLTGKPNPPDAVFQAMRSDQLVDAPFIDSER